MTLLSANQITYIFRANDKRTYYNLIKINRSLFYYFTFNFYLFPTERNDLEKVNDKEPIKSSTTTLEIYIPKGPNTTK